MTKYFLSIYFTGTLEGKDRLGFTSHFTIGPKIKEARDMIVLNEMAWKVLKKKMAKEEPSFELKSVQIINFVKI